MKEKIIKCPHCGGERTNNVSWSNNYCMDCGLEFNIKSGKLFRITYKGCLVDYCKSEYETINELMNCG